MLSHAWPKHDDVMHELCEQKMMKGILKPTVSKAVIITVAAAMLLLTGYAQRPTALNLVKQSGELVIVTRNSATTYYEAADGSQAGFEYDLMSLFANELGVKLKVIVPDDFHSILSMVARGEADIAAAGLTITEARQRRVNFSTPYQTVTQQVVYRSGAKAPRSVEDLSHGYTEVVGGSSHAEQLRSHASSLQSQNWRENYSTNIEELLAKVSHKKIDYTIADSLDVRLNQRHYPELRVAFDLTQPEQLAWALPKSSDLSLQNKVNAFLAKLKDNGELAQLQDKHFGHIKDFDYVGTRTFIKHIDKRLSRYIDHFKTAADKRELDWQLIAAIGYQESHWNPKAISPTGVRGIMMLTRSTAAEMGITNRIDPKNSIYGGTRYFKTMLKRIPKGVQFPDRTWFALAAYNVGFGHLEDARKLTQKRGGNPNKWIDVKQTLPLLMQKRWYKQTKHGYARGMEAITYVQNIRGYYDMLKWQTTTANKKNTGGNTKLTALAKISTAINISPIL